MNVGRLVVPVIRWQANTGFEHERDSITAALRFGAGGFILFGGPAEQVRQLTDELVTRAGRPLLLGADLERGAGQQFAGLREVPPPAALASLGDLTAIRQAGAMTAEDARAVGINWVYAPVADLDLEPDNPIVQTRSFGTDAAQVAPAVAAWIEGAAESGVLTCAKHFPGHGRTTRDSHDQLPTVMATRDELSNADLVPFRAAIQAGVDSIMTCHVAFPALDDSRRPATLSAPILRLLRQDLGFQGLVVTDAMIMEAFKAGGSGVAPALDAVRAGVDVLLYPPEPAATVAELEGLVAKDNGFGTAVEAALRRYEAALAKAVARPARRTGVPKPAVMADRMIRTGEPEVRLTMPLDLLVIDDDLDGAHPASSSDHVRAALAANGVALGSGGSRVALVFSEPRASKGRGGLGRRAVTQLAQQRLDLVVLFGHPRLQAQLPRGCPLLVAWHRQQLMQEAAARWLTERCR